MTNSNFPDKLITTMLLEWVANFRIDKKLNRKFNKKIKGDEVSEQVKKLLQEEDQKLILMVRS